jgi:hypothetical protein
MHAEQVSLGVVGEGDEAILNDRHFLSMDPAAGFDYSRRFR